MHNSTKVLFWLIRIRELARIRAMSIAGGCLLLLSLTVISSVQALTIDGIDYTLSPSSSQVTDLGTLATYGYDSGLNWTSGGSELRLAATVSGISITFIVAKQNGLVFQNSGTMTIRAGAYNGCVANLNTYVWSYNAGDFFTSATYDLASYTDEQGGLPAGKLWYAAVGQPTPYCDGTPPSYYSGPLSLSPSTPSSSLAFFDGAGSLIDSTQNIGGANSDLDKMHPHPGKPSTVVFQFKKGDNCDHIDIDSTPTIDALIQAKSWSNDEISTAFGGALPMSVPNQGGWTVVAVTSANPLKKNEPVTVYARCKPISSLLANNAVTPFNSSESKWVALDNGYFWAGTGSIMSYLGGTGAGKREDYVPVFLSRNSLSSIQWYASTSCSRLKLENRALGNATVAVEVKKWDAPSWVDYSSECSNLPCTISVPSFGYYVVKVAVNASGSSSYSSSILHAQCTN